MANISKTLELKDRFSSVFDRWISNIQKAIEGERGLDGAMQQLEARAESSTQVQSMWDNALSEMANKTLYAKDSLDNFIATYQKLYNDPNAPAELIGQAWRSIQEQFDAAGWSFTSAADDFDQMALLADHDLEKLHEKGLFSFGELDKAAKKSAESVEEIDKAAKKTSGIERLGKKALAIAASFLTARKLLQLFRQAAERAPDEIAAPFNKLKENVRNIFDKVTVSGLAALTPTLERINALLASPAGEKFIDVLSRIGFFVGQVVGGALELLISLLEELIAGFEATGIKAEDVFGFIAGLVGGIYTTIHNIVANIWNIVASFAEFLVNVWKNPKEAIITLFYRIADAVLGFLQTIGDGFDALMEKIGVTTGVGGWLSGIRDSAAERLNASLARQGDDAFVLQRMEYLNYEETTEKWSSMARDFKSSDISLKSIDKNTGSIRKALEDADIAALIDVAERQFISQVNLTSQTPIITVNGANTGNTQQDRINLANALRDVLLEQVATGTFTSTNPYVGASHA